MPLADDELHALQGGTLLQAGDVNACGEVRGADGLAVGGLCREDETAHGVVDADAHMATLGRADLQASGHGLGIKATGCLNAADGTRAFLHVDGQAFGAVVGYGECAVDGRIV